VPQRTKNPQEKKLPQNARKLPGNAPALTSHGDLLGFPCFQVSLQEVIKGLPVLSFGSRIESQPRVVI
jgi:hypothetical protein